MASAAFPLFGAACTLRAGCRMARCRPATLRTVPAAPISGRAAASNAGPRPDFDREIRRLRDLDDHLRFFREQQDLLAPPGLCLLLEGLWAAALAGRREDASVEAARHNVFNNHGFLQLMKDILWKLDRFGPGELPRLLAQLHSMSWHDKHLFKIAEPLVVRNLPQVSLQDFPRLVTSYVAVQCGSRTLFDEFVHRGSQVVQDMDHNSLADLAAAFAESPHKPRAFLVGVGPLVTSRLLDFDARQLARLAIAYARCARDIPPAFVSRLVSRLGGSAGVELFEELPVAQVVAVLRALVAISRERRAHRVDLSPIFQAAAVSLVTADLTALPPRDSAVALWALTKTPTTPPRLLQALYEEIVGSAQTLPESSLATCLLVTARGLSGRLQPPSRDATGPEEGEEARDADGREVLDGNTRLFDLRLHDAAEERVKKVICNFRPRELTSVTLAYAMSQAGSPELFAVLQRACLERSREFPMEQVSSLLWSFATIRMGPKFFREVQVDILEKINQLTVPAICDIMWSYCVVRHHDPHFFKALLSTLLPSKIAGDPRCALLCPALMDVQARLPELDPEGLERYAGYARVEFREQQQAAAAPTALRQDVALALESLGWQQEELVDIDGYVVDNLANARVAAELNDVRPVAVFCHSLGRSLHLRTKEPLGQTMLRQRYLRDRGYVVVNILDEAWEGLEAAEKVAFLEARMLPASASETSI